MVELEVRHQQDIMVDLVVVVVCGVQRVVLELVDIQVEAVHIIHMVVVAVHFLLEWL
jgi:hypothetical protein